MRFIILTFVLLLTAVPRAAQAPSAQGPSHAVATVDPQANYVVGPEDMLAVTVFNEPQLSGRFRVENDGHFSYPFLGRVKAGGTTVAEVAATLRGRLADGYLRNPQVTVEVEQFRSQSVFVMGEVRTPGKYTLSGAVTLLEALAQAGLNDRAGRRGDAHPAPEGGRASGGADRRHDARAATPTCSASTCARSRPAACRATSPSATATRSSCPRRSGSSSPASFARRARMSSSPT